MGQSGRQCVGAEEEQDKNDGGKHGVSKQRGAKTLESRGGQEQLRMRLWREERPEAKLLPMLTKRKNSVSKNPALPSTEAITCCSSGWG